MYNTNGKLKTPKVGYVPNADNIKPSVAWQNIETGDWYFGGASGDNWRQVEEAWAFDTYGNWTGAPPTFIQPFQAHAIDTIGSPLPRVREGFDMITHVASSTPFKVIWKKRTTTSPNGIYDPDNSVVNIYSASTGNIVVHQEPVSLPIDIEALPSGSYAIHIQYIGIQEGLKIPPGATRNSAYDYITGDGRTSHYNPYQNWGEVPTDPDHPLRVLRAQLVQSNQTQDVEEYAAYLTSESPRDGQGAMILVQIGGGFWTMGEHFVSPARALFKLQFTEGEPSGYQELVSDPLVSELTWRKKLYNGRILIGGSRMNSNGTHPAVWEWSESAETITPIAAAEDACDPICEQMMSLGGVSGIEELDNGNVIVTTLCSRHRLNEEDSSPEKRLPRSPSSTDGEPGGRSMVSIGSRTIHLTEKLNNVNPDPDTETFYDLIVDVLRDTLEYGPGVVAHVDNALWMHFGKPYGIRADKAPTEPDARIFSTYYAGSWNKSAQSYRADWLYLTRGVSVNGKMINFGFVPGQETARAVRNDSIREKVVECDYRVRHIFLQDSQVPGYNQAVCIGRKVLDSNTLDSGWTIFSLDGLLEDESMPSVPDIPTGEGILYRFFELKASPGPIYGVHLLDVSIDSSLSEIIKQEGPGRVRLRVDSQEDLDDFSTYNYIPELNKKFVLPIEAKTSVQGVVFWDEDMGDLDVPLMYERI